VIRTFVDSGVLIAAARGTDAIAIRALEILDEPNRWLISSDFVRLEVIPKAIYEERQAEVEFYDEFFERVRTHVHSSRTLVEEAQSEACVAGLSAVDALHVAAAKRATSAELVTTERNTKPLFRATGILVRSIQP